MPSNHFILSCPHLLPPSILPSIRVFSNEVALHIRWSKYWSFSFNIRHSNEYSGLISFRIDWFYLLVVQGTLKSLLQHHSSKAPVLLCSAFFMVQLSHPYMTTEKTIALIIRTFVSNIMSLFNMLSRFVIAFFQGSSFNFMATVTIGSDSNISIKFTFFNCLFSIFLATVDIPQRWGFCLFTIPVLKSTVE